MESLILLLKSLIFYIATTLAVDENSRDKLIDGSRLSNDVIPLHYEVHLDLHDADNAIFSHGECKISILVNHPTRNIRFYANKSQIWALKFHVLESANSSTLNYSTKNMRLYQPTNELYDVKTGIYTFSFAEELSNGYYKMFLMFVNIEDNTNKELLFRTSFINNDGNRTWLIATDLWPMGARRLFPCWDDPIFQANFTIIIKHPKSYKILSNMPKQEIITTEDSDIIRTRFEKTPPIPTYHVSVILLSSYFISHTFLSSNMADIYIEHREQLNYHYIYFTLSVLDKITQYFKSQRMYLQNLKQLSHVAIPGFQQDVMSNLGLISYRETAIIFDEKNDPPMRQIDIARLLGHAMAYQCLYSNRINPSSWSSMWLNQGISTLLAIDAIDQAFPNYRIKDLFVVQTLQESLRLDTNSIMKPLISEVNSISDIDSGFYFAYYIKAPAILRMLQQTLREFVFQDGLKKYLSNDSSYSGKTNIETFWHFLALAIQAAHEEDKTYDVEHFNVKDKMEAWTTREHYPVINVTQNETVITVTTKSTNTSKKEWWIPYISTTKEDPDFPLIKSMQYVSTNGDPLTYEDTDWIIVNFKQTGYYRVNYDAQSLEKIANYLNSDQYIRVHVLNRAQIMDDAFHFLIKGQLDLSIFLKLTTYLSKERNYIAWYPMFKAFEYLSSFFPFKESFYIKGQMMRLLGKLHQEIGHEEKSDPIYFNSSLKQEVARWACVFESYECKKQAYFKLSTHLLQKEKSLLPWWKEWTYCNGLLGAENATWDKVFQIYIEKPNYILLKSLTCSEDISITRKCLELIASKHYDEKIKDNDRIYIFHSIVARRAQYDTVLDYILENLHNIKPREMSMPTALIDIINHVYSNSSLDKINKFLDGLAIDWPIDLLTHPLIDGRLHNKLRKCMTCTRDNHISDLIILGKVMLLKLKIELRSSEIMRHVHHFRNFKFINLY